MTITSIPTNNDTFKSALDEVRGLMADLSNVVTRNLPETLKPLKTALAVAAIACLRDEVQPISLIFAAPSGAGKTMALEFLMPASDDDAHFYRSDDFTAASFVSHRADKDDQQLREQVDLLPKLKDKTLITKELGPVFRGKREELEKRFAILTSVLDGQGYVSNSGAHGRRGYQERINFRWLGATTPLSNEALEVIASLGTRMFFYSLDRERKDTDALIEVASDSRHEAKKQLVRKKVQEFIAKFFDLIQPGSLKIGQVGFPQVWLRKLVLLAKVAAALRTMKIDSDKSPVEVAYPERAILMLRQIAIGSALINGRSEVELEDIRLVAQVAVSSGPWNRQKVFRALIRAGGRATTFELERLTGLAGPTVRKWMEHLGRLGLGKYTDGESGRGNSATLELLDEYMELVPDKWKAKRGEGEKPEETANA
jgi:hypothetical protein